MNMYEKYFSNLLHFTYLENVFAHYIKWISDTLLSTFKQTFASRNIFFQNKIVPTETQIR